jgi:hypothetical protein
MKALLVIGIVLVVGGMAAAFGPQLYVTLSTGLPSNGVDWLKTAGFVVSATGAVAIGVWIGKRRTRRRVESQASAAARRDEPADDQTPWYEK